MNILGIDFEDWYHPELVKRNIKDEKHEPSVLNGIDKILDLLRKHDTFATFFVVGELLEFQQEIFDKIIDNEHEIGFHTMKHTRIDSPNFKEKFEEEIKKFDNSHDRFLIIDENEVYHIGASLKDLGKKWFAFSKIDMGSLSILEKLK